MRRFAPSIVSLLLASAAWATEQSASAREDTSKLRTLVEQFLAAQSAGLPGDVAIQVGQIDPRANLRACVAPQPFLANSNRAWGKTMVGVRCSAPTNWTIYIGATVQVIADYLVTAMPVAQGQSLAERDLIRMRGDLAALPAGIMTEPALAIGRTMAVSLPSGVPLRHDALRNRAAVQQGQTIKLIGSGRGFQVSAEARALNNATEGQIAQARTTSGQVVSGVARAGGIVEVTF